MKFSIVIPTYNGARYVESALQSALSQTRPADEIIVSDDHSSDETLAICRRYEARGVRIVEHPHGPSGFVGGWNNAIAHASGDYVSILHQDDLLMPTFLEEAEEALRTFPGIRHLFASCNYIDGQGRLIREGAGMTGEVRLYEGYEYIRAYRSTPGHIHRCPGVLTHRSVFGQCLYRAEAGHIADDDFFYRVARLTKVVGILKPLACYRHHGQSETGHLSDLLLVERLCKCYDFQLSDLGRQPRDAFHEEDARYFRHNMRRFSKRLIAYGVKGFQWRTVCSGLFHYCRSILLD